MQLTPTELSLHSQKNMDEFSDFQMAVQLPPPSLGVQPSLFGKNHGISKPPSGKPMSSSTGLRFSSDSSPVHSISSHPSKSDFLNSQVTSMSNHSAVVAPSLPPAPSAATKGGASVGSRLANYDLGLSGPQTPTNGLSNNLDLTTSTVSPFPANFPKTINNLSNHHHQPQPSLQIQRTNQDLLIGEEDKYSALRMLIETDMSSSCSVFEKPVISGACPSTDSTHVPMNTESFNNKPTLQTNNSNISNGTSSFNMNSTVATSSTSVFDANVSNSLNCNNSSVVNSNNLMATLKYPPGNDFLTKPTPPPVAPSIETPTVAADDDSDFGDFGDFQSFTGFTPTPAPVASAKPSSNSFTFSIPSNGTSFGDFQFQTAPAPTTPQISNSVIPQRPVTFDLFSPITPIAPASSLPPLSLQNGACNNDDDDDDDDTEFGDFVSVEPVVSEAVEEIRQCSSLPPVPAAAPLPTNSRWNKHFDLAPIGLIQQTPPPLPKVSSQDDKENVEDIMDIGSYFSKYTSPLENDLTLPKPKTQQSLSLQPPPQQTIAEAEDEDFDAFTGFASATIIKNDLSTRNSDQNKTLDCSIAKPTLPSNPTPSTNTFIRTSLIRNDKVTEIDPVKWNQSVEESNNDCAILDSYSSFDRKDFSVVDGGKSKFLDISPETRSIASLDLGNYVTVDYSEASHTNNNLNNNNNNNNNSICNPIVPLQNQFSQHGGGKSMSPVIPGIIPFSKADDQTIYDEYDKYQCFRDECENVSQKDIQFQKSWSSSYLRETLSKEFSFLGKRKIPFRVATLSPCMQRDDCQSTCCF